MSFIKLITESFHENNFKESDLMESKSLLNIKQIDDLILENKNKLIDIKTKYNNIKNTWESLKEDIQSFSFYNNTNPQSIKEQFQKSINDLKIEYNDVKSTLNFYKEYKSNLLLEDKDTNNANKENLLKIKYQPVFEELQKIIDTTDIYNVFEYLFNSLVPKYGKAETKAGEIIRALMRIMYGVFNNNYVFYEGKGKDIFGNAARFLKDMGYEEYLDDAIGLTNDPYIDVMELIIEKIIRDFISTQEELFYTENKTDYESITLKENTI